MGVSRELLRKSIIRFAMCWTVFPCLLLSASQGKLATYALPCFPPLALLISAGLGQYSAQGRRRVFVVACRVLASLVALAGTVVVIAQIGGFMWAPYEKGESWKWILAFDAVIVFAALSLEAARRREMPDRVFALGAAMVLPMFALHLSLPDFVPERNGPGDLILKNASMVNPRDPVVGSKRTPHAICWYLKRTDVYVIDKAGELKRGLEFPDARDRYLLSEDFKEFVAGFAPGKLVTVVVDRKYYLPRQQWFPVPVVHETNGTYEFLQFRSGSIGEGN
jgi:4-amino-4-deoxy-L-arabinose transferase